MALLVVMLTPRDAFDACATHTSHLPDKQFPCSDDVVVWQAELAPMQDDEDVKRLREENGHSNGHFQVFTMRYFFTEQHSGRNQKLQPDCADATFLSCMSAIHAQVFWQPVQAV